MQQYMSAGPFSIEDSQSAHKNPLLCDDLLCSNEFHNFVALIMNFMKDTLNRSDGQRWSAKHDLGHAFSHDMSPISIGTLPVSYTQCWKVCFFSPTSLCQNSSIYFAAVHIFEMRKKTWILETNKQTKKIRWVNVIKSEAWNCMHYCFHLHQLQTPNFTELTDPGHGKTVSTFYNSWFTTKEMELWHYKLLWQPSTRGSQRRSVFMSQYSDDFNMMEKDMSSGEFEDIIRWEKRTLLLQRKEKTQWHKIITEKNILFQLFLATSLEENTNWTLNLHTIRAQLNRLWVLPWYSGRMWGL